jgi:hypothetical protein
LVVDEQYGGVRFVESAVGELIVHASSIRGEANENAHPEV